MAYRISDWTLDDVGNGEELIVVQQQDIKLYPPLVWWETYYDSQQKRHDRCYSHWYSSGWNGGQVSLVTTREVLAFCTMPAGGTPQRPSILDDGAYTLPAGTDLTLGVLGTTGTRAFPPLATVSYLDDPEHPVTTPGQWRLVAEPFLVGYENTITGVLRWRCRWRTEGQIIKAFRWRGDVTLNTFHDATPRTIADAMPGSITAEELNAMNFPEAATGG